MSKIRVTIWNEFVHEREMNAAGEFIRRYYPAGIHNYLAEVLAADDLEIRTASLEQTECGLPDELLENTDVLVWWSHVRHTDVPDQLAEKITDRVRRGMGFIPLHSSHLCKPFRQLMGTRCRLHWRDVGEKERVWTVAPEHPVAAGVPETFVIPHSEMYGERFDIPDDAKIVFMSWYEGGNVFRSGVAFVRDQGKIFYFSPGHEAYPIYHDPNVQRVLANAIRWTAPARIFPPCVTPTPESLEPIRSSNPLTAINPDELH